VAWGKVGLLSDDHVPAQFKYAPFRDESHWRTFQHLVDDLDLPPYEPSDQRLSVSSRLLRALGALIIAPGLLLAAVVPRGYSVPMVWDDGRGEGS